MIGYIIKKEISNTKIVGMGLVATFGALQFLYYLGRQEAPLLSCISFPLAALAILPLDWAVTQLTKYRKERHYMTWPTLIIGLTFFSLMSATFIDKYTQYPSTYSILWAYLTNSKRMEMAFFNNPVEAFKHIKKEIAQESFSNSSYKETINLINKYQKNKQDILLFHLFSTKILFLLQKHHNLGFSSPINESLSPTLTKKLANNVSSVNPKDIVIISWNLLNALELESIGKLQAHWQLCLLESAMESGHEVSAYRLESRNGQCQTSHLESVILVIMPCCEPFMLPDGSEVTSDSLHIWVKQPGQGYYATSWESYVKEKGLSIRAVLLFGPLKQKPQLRISRNTAPFKLPDGSEVAIKKNNEIFVKKPMQPDFSIPWETYAKEKGLQLNLIVY